MLKAKLRKYKYDFYQPSAILVFCLIRCILFLTYLLLVRHQNKHEILSFKSQRIKYLSFVKKLFKKH